MAAHPSTKDTDCICNACRIKYNNKAKDSKYTPEKSREKVRSQLCILSNEGRCQSNSQVDSNISVEQFNRAFDLQYLLLPSPTPLCHQHRLEVVHFKELTECAVCGHLLKVIQSTKFYRLDECEKVSMEKLLLINESFRVNEGDLICKQCYNFSSRQQVLTDLEKTIDSIETTLSEVSHDEEDSVKPKSILKRLCKKTFKEICKWLKSCCGFLLADAYDYFLRELEKVLDKNSDKYEQCSKKGSWLMSRILGKFGCILSVHKSTKKKGVFLYLTSATIEQLLESLHNANSHLRLLKKGNVRQEDDISTLPLETEAQTLDHMYRVLILECNTRLKNQSKRIKEYYTRDPLSIDKFNFNEALSSFDPVIWNVVCLLTSNSEEIHAFKKTSLHVAKDLLSFPNDHTPFGMQRKIRRIVLVFILQFVLSDFAHILFM